MSGADPVCEAIYNLTLTMTQIAVGEANGYWNGRTCEGMREVARKDFYEAMQREADKQSELPPPPAEGG